jgi:hypothetical protein
MTKLCAIFVFASCIIMGCSANPTNSTPVSPGESAMNMKQEYLRQTANLNPQTKEHQQQRVKILVQLLDECGEAKRQTEFERLVGKSEQTDKAFDTIFAQAFVEYFLKRKDTASLQKLLAGRCPDYVGGIPLEFVLAASSAKMLLPLPRAFQTASDESRGTILACLARAFPTLKQPGVSDTDFARECERWVSQNSENSTMNRSYPYLPALPPPDPRLPADASKVGLFIAKEK